jgi:signal peptidase I
MEAEQGSHSSPPSRGVAIALALLGPWGTGQIYLGQTRRGFLWLVIPSAFVAPCFIALPILGGMIGYGRVLAIVVIATLVTWFASLVDVHLVPPERVRRVHAGWVFGYWVLGVLFTIAVRLPIRALVIEAFRIPSASMAPSILVGDHLMADKLVLRARHPKRGEAIVFQNPEHPEQDFVKRVIAVPGDRLEVRGGHPSLNGWEVPHCRVGTATVSAGQGESSTGEVFVEFLDGETYLTFFDQMASPTMTEFQGPYSVPQGEVWVMGDNRHNSHDSRFWNGGVGGGVPFELVKGRALFRYLTEETSGIDWSRYGTPIATPLLPATMKNLEPELRACLANAPPREKTVPPPPR